VIPRGVDRAVVGGTSALGVAILAACVVLADSPPLVYLRLALVALAVSAAFVLDDAATAAVDAVPRTRRRRTADRLLAVAVPLTVWGVGIAVFQLRTPATPAAGLLVEGAGALTVAVAAAAVLRWAGRAEPGEIAATVVGGTMLALIVFDLPSWWPVPLFPGDAGWPASTALWSGLGVASAVVVILASADPYRPSRPVGMRSAHVPWLAWSGGDPEPDGDGRSSPGSSPRWWVCRR
jgi:hypothetical protein